MKNSQSSSVIRITPHGELVLAPLCLALWGKHPYNPIMTGFFVLALVVAALWVGSAIVKI
jgi:hypothetical protein